MVTYPSSYVLGIMVRLPFKLCAWNRMGSNLEKSPKLVFIKLCSTHVITCPFILISLYLNAWCFMIICILMQMQYFITLFYEFHDICCLIKISGLFQIDALVWERKTLCPNLFHFLLGFVYFYSMSKLVLGPSVFNFPQCLIFKFR